MDDHGIKAKLMAIAYRMLGSIQDAEDAVQDSLLSWHLCDQSAVKNREAWLVKVCTRKCLDSLKAAKRKREVYPGVWLPEPVVEEANPWTRSDNPESSTLLSESLTMAFMILLDNLAPEERAIFLLTEVFNYSSVDVADILGKTPANCRKIKERAKDKITPRESQSEVDSKQLDLLRELFEAATIGNRDRLLAILAEDCSLYGDGGGKATAAAKVLVRAEEIAAMFLGIAKFMVKSGAQIRTHFCMVNHRPGLVVIRTFPEPETVETVFSADVHQGKVTAIYAMRNPDKLTRCI